MIASVLGIRLMLTGQWPMPVSLGVQVLIGAAAYLGTVVGLHGERLRTFYELIWSARV